MSLLRALERVCSLSFSPVSASCKRLGPREWRRWEEGKGVENCFREVWTRSVNYGGTFHHPTPSPPCPWSSLPYPHPDKASYLLDKLEKSEEKKRFVSHFKRPRFQCHLATDGVVLGQSLSETSFPLLPKESVLASIRDCHRDSTRWHVCDREMSWVGTS